MAKAKENVHEGESLWPDFDQATESVAGAVHPHDTTEIRPDKDVPDDADDNSAPKATKKAAASEKSGS